MFPEDQGPAEAATGFTDQLIDAAVAKLDALFGAGYAKGNPQALAAYIAACAANLNAFMTAATSIDDDGLEEAFEAFAEELRPAPEPRPKGRRR